MKTGMFVDNDLPTELIGDQEIEPLCSAVQHQFDQLFQNDGETFQYVGFSDLKGKEKFEETAAQLAALLGKRTTGEYIVINNFSIV